MSDSDADKGAAKMLLAALLTKAGAGGGAVMGDQMGPPSPREYPIHRIEGRDYEPSPAGIKDLWPVALGMAMDLVTTANVQGRPIPGTDRIGIEANPMPGMQSNTGRAGWALAELLASHYLTRNNPKARKILKAVRPAISGGLAMNNAALAQGRDVEEMRLTGTQER